MRRFLIIFTLLATVFQLNIHAEKKQYAPDEFLNMNTDRAFEIIAGLNKTEAEELVSGIRQAAKKDYKKIDNFYFLISHLESIKAVEKEQKRLASLNMVYALGFLLFTGFTLYLFLAQRKTIRELKAYLEK